MKDKLPLIKTYLTSFPSGFGASRMFDVIKIVADNAFIKVHMPYSQKRLTSRDQCL
jgi:hypothetical protein